MINIGVGKKNTLRRRLQIELCTATHECSLFFSPPSTATLSPDELTLHISDVFMELLRFDYSGYIRQPA